MRLEIREAALCLFRRERSFLVAALQDRVTGEWLHRPPGGGVQPGESAEDALRREIREELGIELAAVEALGPIDHIWIWNGREVQERAWIFLADAACDPRLARGEAPELVEANHRRFHTLWRAVDVEDAPPLCPAGLTRLFSFL